MTNRKIIRFGRAGTRIGIEAKTGLSTSHIYEITNPDSPRYDPTFPKRIALSARAVGYFEDEVDAWLDRRNHAQGIERQQQFLALQQGLDRFREDVKTGKRTPPSKRRKANAQKSETQRKRV